MTSASANVVTEYVVHCDEWGTCVMTADGDEAAGLFIESHYLDMERMWEGCTDDEDRYPLDIESMDYDEIEVQYGRNAHEAGCYGKSDEQYREERAAEIAAEAYADDWDCGY